MSRDHECPRDSIERVHVKKEHLNRTIAAGVTLAMVIGQVPTAATAHAVDGRVPAAEQQTETTQGPSDSSDEGVSAPDGGKPAGSVEDQKEAPAPTVDEGADSANDESQLQGGSVGEGLTAEVASDQEVSSLIDVQTTESLRYHAKLTEGELRNYLYNTFGKHVTNYKIVLNGNEKVVEPGWALSNKVLNPSLASGTYSVQYYDTSNWNLSKWGYKDCGSFELQRYWTATFNAAGCADGGVLIDGVVASSYDIDEGATKTFTPKQVEDYDVVSVMNGTSEITPNEDGSYTIPSGADSNIVISYKAAVQANIKVEGDEGLDSATVGGVSADEDDTIVVNYKNPGDIVAKPKDGYAVAGVVLVDDADRSEVTLSAPSYSNHVATVAGVPALTKDGHYTLKVSTVKAGIKGIDGAEVGVLGRSDKSAYKQLVFNAAFDQQGSVPAGLSADDVEIKFNAGGTFGDVWRSLDFTPGLFNFGQHEFGANGDGSTEQIRITYAGNDQYPGSSVELSVTVVDGRYKTEMSCNTNVSIQYNTDADAMRDELYKALAPRVTYTDDAGNTATVPGTSNDSFEFDGIKLPTDVGEYTGVTVKYKGTASEGDQLGYQPCSAEGVTVTVTKAPSKVKVTSKSLTYGETVKIADLVNSEPGNEETKPITVIAGIDGDAKGYVSVDLSYYSPAVQKVINQVLKLDQGISLSKLAEIVNNDATMSALTAMLKLAGVENPEQIVNGLKTVLNSLTQYGLGSSTVALGGTPSKAGVYVTVAATTSGNYKTSVGMGYLTIAPKTTDISLKWKQELPHKVLSYDEAQNFTFGANVFDGDKDITGKANVHVTYAGITAEGKAYLSSGAPRVPGAYTETATVIGGNYLAKPISRAFSIGRNETKVTITGDAFTYNGTAQGPTVVVTDPDDNPIEGAEVTLLYMGTTSMGERYVSTTAPTNAGSYTAIATYAGDATHDCAAAVARFTIAKADVSISVDNATVTYNGAAQGLTATATIADGAIDVSGQLVMRYGGKDVEPTDAGTYKSFAIFPGNGNINGTSAPATLTIASRPVTITPQATFSPSREPLYKVSGAKDPDLGFTVEDGAAGTAPWKGERDLVTTVCDALKPVVSRADSSEEPGEYDIMVSVTENKNFAPTLGTCTLTILPRIAVEGSENGTAELAGDGLVEDVTSEGETLQGAKPGTTLALSAKANDGYAFTGWTIVSGDATIDDAGVAQATLTVGNQNVVVKPNFSLSLVPIDPSVIKFNVKVSVADDEGGSASCSPEAGATGETVTIFAAPDDGYEFDYWEVASGGIELADADAATTTFVMGSAQPHVVAHFKKVAAPTPAPEQTPAAPASPVTPASDKSGVKTAKKTGPAVPETGDPSAVVAPLALAGTAAIAAAALRRRRED